MFKLLDTTDCGESFFKKFVINQVINKNSASATIFLTNWRQDEKGWKKHTDETIFQYFDDFFAENADRCSTHRHIYETLKEAYIKNDRDPWYTDRIECISLEPVKYEFKPECRSLR